ncbi:hypothetical protein TWF281_010619 [Arthrobotrys megalospora]
MLRLSGSQVLLTNRDVTRTLNPKRTRRPPTYLYTKGKQPLRSSSYPASSIPHINTSRPSTSSSTFPGQTDRIPPSSAPVQPSSPDWSTSSDTESSSTDGNMPEQSNLNRSTDGPNDEMMTAYLREMGPFRQVISLETIDSFPFVPYRPPPSLMFQIYEDPMPSPVGSDAEFDFMTTEWDPEPFGYLGSSYRQADDTEDVDGDDDYGHENFENSDGNGGNGGDGVAGDDEEEEEEPIILNEMIWNPDTMLIVEPGALIPVPDARAPEVAAELLESPPQ